LQRNATRGCGATGSPDGRPEKKFTFYASRFTHHVLRITFYASRFTHHVLRITFYASRFTHHALRITFYASHFTKTENTILTIRLIDSTVRSQFLNYKRIPTDALRGKAID